MCEFFFFFCVSFFPTIDDVTRNINVFFVVFVLLSVNSLYPCSRLTTFNMAFFACFSGVHLKCYSKGLCVTTATDRMKALGVAVSFVDISNLCGNNSK